MSLDRRGRPFNGPRRAIVSRRCGPKAARDQYAPAIGALEATWPLSLVQIDHTLVDVIVVDRASRQPLQRPWLTLAVDVASRMVAGFYLTLEPPSVTSVALAIQSLVLPKQAYLARLGVDGAHTLHLAKNSGDRSEDAGDRTLLHDFGPVVALERVRIEFWVGVRDARQL